MLLADQVRGPAGPLMSSLARPYPNFPETAFGALLLLPQRMGEEMGEGLLLTSRSWASPNPCPWTKSTPPPLFLCLGHASPPSFHAAPAYTALEIPGSRNNDLFPENTGQRLYPCCV